MRWGRYSIGFEIREDYCHIAAQRIADMQKQTASLF
jgi:adenine-specific DNA-methyltransferase